MVYLNEQDIELKGKKGSILMTNVSHCSGAGLKVWTPKLDSALPPPAQVAPAWASGDCGCQAELRLVLPHTLASAFHWALLTSRQGMGAGP